MYMRIDAIKQYEATDEWVFLLLRGGRYFKCKIISVDDQIAYCIGKKNRELYFKISEIKNIHTWIS